MHFKRTVLLKIVFILNLTKGQTFIGKNVSTSFRFGPFNLKNGFRNGHTPSSNSECGSINVLDKDESYNFASPFYPQEYYNFARCQWEFYVSTSNNLLGLQCSVFELAKQGLCNPFVDFFLVEAPGGVQRWYCGETTPPILFAPAFRITFWSNHRVTAQGFVCQIKAFDPSEFNTTTTATTGPTTESPGFRTCKCGRALSRRKRSIESNKTNGFRAMIPLASTGNSFGDAGRVVGGSISTLHEIPWLVFLLFLELANTYCSGTLINDRYVLTAAHCVQTFTPVVVLGEYDRTTSIETSRTLRYAVSEVITHPGFNTDTKTNDIALLRLSSSIDLDSVYPYIAPVCPPEENDLFINQNALVVGWGYLTEDAGQGSNIPYKTFVKVLSNDECQNLISTNTDLDTDITDTMICAYAAGKDACLNDSGSPLLIYVEDKWQIIGLVSFGYGCARENTPGVYTRVNKYIGWITENISNSSTCSP